MTAIKRTSSKPKAVVEDKEEPVIRVTFTSEDMCRLLDRLEGWDDPIAHRLRMRYSKHRMRWE